MSNDRFKPNEERRQRIKVLTEWYAKLTDGQRITWVEVEQQTGLTMHGAGEKNRKDVGLVARRLHRHYLPLPGVGFEVSSSANAGEIVGKSFRKMVNGVTATRVVAEDVMTRHGEQLPQATRNHLLHMQAVLATTRLTSELAKPPVIGGRTEK